MKIKIICIVFFLLTGCFYVEMSYAQQLRHPVGEIDLEKLINEAREMMLKLTNKIDEAEKANLKNKKIVKTAKEKLKDWQDTFDEYKTNVEKYEDPEKEYGFIIIQCGRYIKGIDKLLAKKKVEKGNGNAAMVEKEPPVPPSGKKKSTKESLGKQNSYDIKRMQAEIGELKKELTMINTKLDQVRISQTSHIKEKFNAIEEKISHIWFWIVLSVILVIILSIILGWYFGKKAALKSLEKAGLW